MATYQSAQIPSQGERIEYNDGALEVPSHPIIPFIEGDGTGPDIWRAASRVLEAAVEKAYAGERRVAWMEILAGEKAFGRAGSWLPDDTIEALREFRVAIKGPLTTPVGGGIRSLNVTLRQELDLYGCIRPVRWFEGVGAPVKDPGKLDVVIFRENTEDVYAGVEFRAGSPEAIELRELLVGKYRREIREGSAIGIKPISEFGSKRLVAMALRYALRAGRPSLTLVHKGNIMKFTEGAFRDWGYELARERFPGITCTESELQQGGQCARADAVVVKDRIADAMFQELLLRPEEHSVIATTNLNGDFLSDAAAAQVGGLGMAPGGNVGDGIAVFEATHGTAPRLAGLDRVNPCAMILSGAMMFEHLGWSEAAALVVSGIEHAIRTGRVTGDLARQMPGSTEVSTTQFADGIIRGIAA
jgi:isocitrate dehydrogenase